MGFGVEGLRERMTAKGVELLRALESPCWRRRLAASAQLRCGLQDKRPGQSCR